MKTNTIHSLRNELSQKAKNGIDFILAASVIWLIIGIIWSLDYVSYTKSIFTFIVGGFLLPLAYGFSKLFKTNWKVKGNPLQPLGLWLNFAQLFYFPFLIFILIANPDYFAMTYAIITGAHLFPFAWLYNTKVYAIAAGFISIGSMLIALNVPQDTMFYVPLFTGISLILTFIFLFKK